MIQFMPSNHSITNVLSLKSENKVRECQINVIQQGQVRVHVIQAWIMLYMWSYQVETGLFDT